MTAQLTANALRHGKIRALAITVQALCDGLAIGDTVEIAEQLTARALDLSGGDASQLSEHEASIVRETARLLHEFAYQLETTGTIDTAQFVTR